MRDVPPPRPVPPPAPDAPAEETRPRTRRPGGGRRRRRPDRFPRRGRRRADADAVGRLGLRDVLGRSPVRSAARSPPGRAERPPHRRRAATGRRRALLGDLLAAAAPRLPIRDGDRLRRAFPGASDDEIADALVGPRRPADLRHRRGGRRAGGGPWFLPPSLLVLPLELGAETVLIGAVEVVLVGELHELHGRPAPGDARARASAYLQSWSEQRAVDGAGAAGLRLAPGHRGPAEPCAGAVTRKLVRSVPTAAPFLIGAAIAGRGNRRATETLAGRVLADLPAPRPAGRNS